MAQIKLDISRVYDFISAGEIKQLSTETLEAQRTLYQGNGPGNDFLGWLHLPSEITDGQLDEMEQAAGQLKDRTEILVVVGIGGSYLGARAVHDALAHSFSHLRPEQKAPHMVFAGQNIGEDYMHELLEVLHEKDYSIVVISKSGTTVETMANFLVIFDLLQEKIGWPAARENLVVTTDPESGVQGAGLTQRQTTNQKDGHNGQGRSLQ